MLLIEGTFNIITLMILKPLFHLKSCTLVMRCCSCLYYLMPSHHFCMALSFQSSGSQFKCQLLRKAFRDHLV